MFKFVPVGFKFPTKLLKLPSFRPEYTGHDLTVLNGGCSADDMEMVTAISGPDGMHFKISVQLLPVLTVVRGAQSLEHFDTRYYVTLLSGAELKLPIMRQEPGANQSKQAMMWFFFFFLVKGLSRLTACWMVGFTHLPLWITQLL